MDRNRAVGLDAINEDRGTLQCETMHGIKIIREYSVLWHLLLRATEMGSLGTKSINSSLRVHCAVSVSVS